MLARTNHIIWEGYRVKTRSLEDPPLFFFLREGGFIKPWMLLLKTTMSINWISRFLSLTLRNYICLYCPNKIIQKAVIGSQLLMQARPKKGSQGCVTWQEFEEPYAASRVSIHPPPQPHQLILLLHLVMDHDKFSFIKHCFSP